MSAAEVTYVVTTSHGSYHVKAACEYEAGKFALARLSTRYPREHVTLIAINTAH